MNHLVVFAFALIISSVAGQAALQGCIIVANTASSLNPGSTCAYFEDAVRCGINDLGLAEDGAKQEDIEAARTGANTELGNRMCNETFDTILNQVKAKPELLELQGCIDTAIQKDLQEGSTNSCNHIEDGVRCAIKAWKLYEENAPADDLMYVAVVSSRYLTPYRCQKTFDDLLTEVKNSGHTVSPIGWFTAVMAAFIVLFTAV